MTVAHTLEENGCNAASQTPSPANTPSVPRLVSIFLLQAMTLYRQVKRRRRFIALLNYDDHMIDDMGLTRAAIEEASKLPLRLNAAHIARVWARQEQ